MRYFILSENIYLSSNDTLITENESRFVKYHFDQNLSEIQKNVSLMPLKGQNLAYVVKDFQ